MVKSLVAVAGIAALLTAGASAQKPQDAPEVRAGRIVDELVACRAIRESVERLACFDRTVAAFETARAGKQLRVVDREDVKKTKRSLFGFSLPDFNLFGGGKDDDDGVPAIKEVDSTIKAVRSRPLDQYTVTLADDTVWAFTEPMVVPPRAGDPIKIQRAALGSYKGSVKGRISVRIRRER